MTLSISALFFAAASLAAIAASLQRATSGPAWKWLAIAALAAACLAASAAVLIFWPGPTA